MIRNLKFEYDTNRFNFRSCMVEVFGTEELSKIHENSDCNFGILSIENDQGTHFHKRFYEKIWDTNFFEIYHDFVRENILPNFEEDILYQKIPTFRIQVPDNLGVAEFHKDKTYSHSPEEINIFLPLTNAVGNNTIWVESEEDKGDYSPMNAIYGEYYVWDGANLSHGNKINDTGNTRISVDFRVLPMSKFDESNVKETITMKTKMTIGGYFEILRKNDRSL